MTFLARWALISLGLHLLAAVFSIGYQNSDEHFQILEFLNYRLGLSSAADLPVEFHRMMRPWLQPALYWLPVQLLSWFGIHDPFSWACAIRLISALLGWVSVVALMDFVRDEWGDGRLGRATIVMLALMWFTPALHARHSSENLGGSLFVLGVWALWRTLKAPKANLPWQAVGIGFLFGLAFEARYQVIVMIAGVAGWLIAGGGFSGLARDRLDPRIRPVSAGEGMAGLFGFGLAVALGTLADRWGYGQWTFAPWNYFQFNMVEGRLAAAGVSPWWDYFRRMWTESWPVLAFLNLLAFIIGWVRKPLHLLTWATAPFFLFHVLVAHKETRFLFPMAPFAAIFVAWAMEASWARRPIARFVTQPVIVLNGVALICLTLLPVWMHQRFYEAVYGLPGAAAGDPIEVVSIGEDPYKILGIPMNFYRPAKLSLVVVSDAAEAYARKPKWLVYSRSTLPTEALELRHWCARRASTYPEWMEKADPTGRIKTLRNWTVFECGVSS